MVQPLCFISMFQPLRFTSMFQPLRLMSTFVLQRPSLAGEWKHDDVVLNLFCLTVVMFCFVLFCFVLFCFVLFCVCDAGAVVQPYL